MPVCAYTPEDRKHDGPAMRALTDQQYLFVEELAEMTAGPDAPKRAAIAAGYNPLHHRTLLRNPRILAALQEVAGHKITAAAIDSIAVAKEISSDPTHKDRLKAAKWLAELAGFTVVSRQEIAVTKTEGDPAAMRAELQRLMAQVGPQAQQLLTAAGIEITDAVFEEIKDPALAPDGEPW